MTDLQTFWEAPIYQFPQPQKAALLLARLNTLTTHHRAHCAPYATLLDSSDYTDTAQSYAEIMPMSVQLFKQFKLQSITDEATFKMLTSSGTSGHKSQIVLDRAAAAAQSKALVKIMQDWLGRTRLPMLLIEQSAQVEKKNGFSARGAGALGLSFLGRDHCYALDEQMQPNWPAIHAFAERYQGQKVFIFGFTFMLWQYLLEPLAQQGLQLPLEQAIIMHSGGWKKLEHLAVSPAQFNTRCQQVLGTTQVHNFYGMAEQTGSVFVSCEQGHLHCPIFSDILIRDSQTLTPLPIGQTGLVEVLSALPESYPGQSILTEDLGVWLGDDDCPCGRKGRYFHILGRVQQAEVRGCSDTFS